MKIDILTEETIPEVVAVVGVKNPEKIAADMLEAVEDAYDHGSVIYVRYDRYFLQRVWVARQVLIKAPKLDEMIRDEEWWIANS